MTFVIKQLNEEHSCFGLTKNIDTPAKWIADKFKVTLNYNPNLNIFAIKDELTHRYGVHVNKRRLYKAKKYTLFKASENFAQSFAKILTKRNSMVLVKLHITHIGNDIKFWRIMISFPALRSSFVNGC